MKSGKGWREIILKAGVFLLIFAFAAKAAWPSILRLYIETGIGNCQKIPLLCMAPSEEILPVLDKDYIARLSPYRFTKMKICAPRDFLVIQEDVKKIYYKKKRPKKQEAVIYLLYKEPDFFINLFPLLRKQGVFNDYEFIKRIMYAKLKDIKSASDAFFVIMKGVFTPDLGEQKNVKMAQITMPKRKGFINYNLTGPDCYFDCNIIDEESGFFKIYIKDKGGSLTLEKAAAIISTASAS